MTALQLPWLEAAVVVLLSGAAWTARQRATDARSYACMWISAIAFALTAAAWIDFATLPDDVSQAQFTTRWGPDAFIIDSLSAPLLPLVALLYFLTFVGTLRTKMRRFSFPAALIREAFLLGIFSCRGSWVLVALLIVRLIPPYLELRSRNRPTGVYVFHMVAFAVLLVTGYALVQQQSIWPVSGWVLAPLCVAVFIRAGIAPFHCWVADLFEHATFGSALLFLTPMVGAYAAVRLILPVASGSALNVIGLISLASALYTAGMAVVQQEARRFFCYLLLSHSALVFVGLESTSVICLTGGLCVWLSIGLALGGLGLTLRALEARHGRLTLVRFQGLYDHTPALAVCFLLTGLASVGFPCTFGFVGTEMLIDGAAHAYPYLVGIVVVIVAALNGIAVVQAYFKIFTGSRHISTVPLGIGIRERWAVLGLAALIFAGGLFPQPGVASRYRAAEELLRTRPEQSSTSDDGHLALSSPRSR